MARLYPLHKNLEKFKIDKEKELLNLFNLKSEQVAYTFLYDFATQFKKGRIAKNKKLVIELKDLKLFCNFIEKMQGIDYEALNFYDSALFSLYFNHFKLTTKQRAFHAASFMEYAFKMRQFNNPNREQLDFLISYKDNKNKQRKAFRIASDLCDSAFEKEVEKKLKMKRSETINTLKKFITLMYENFSDDDKSYYYSAFEKYQVTNF